MSDKAGKGFRAGVGYLGYSETPEQFMRHIRALEALTAPVQECVFTEQMRTAKENGFTYREALEHVVRVHHGGSD